MKRGLLAAALLCGCSANPPPPEKKPVLHILTSLPLFFGEGGVSEALQAEAPSAPLVSALAERWTIRPLDIARPAQLDSVRALLIAQPHALAPDELVAIDDWVRSGGRAIILADPDLRWPSNLPLGDPRRAPSVTLLGPLWVHWGLTLIADAPDAPSRRAVIGGSDVWLAGSGQWQTKGTECRVTASVLAMCALGKGAVAIIADADFLRTDASPAGQNTAAQGIDQLFDEMMQKDQPVSKKDTPPNRPPKNTHFP